MQRCRHGRRQERLARGDDRRRCPARRQRCRAVSPPPRTPTAISSRRTDSRRASAPSSPALDVDDVAKLAATGAQHPPVDPRHAVRRRHSSRRCSRRSRAIGGGRGVRGRGALVGDRGGSAGGLVRRPAGDLPQRARRSSTCSRRMHEVFASLFNDRAISYRVHKGFDHDAVALSAGVQHMVRSDLGASRRHVHARHRLGLPRRGVHHRLVGTRRDGGAGSGEPGRVLRLQAGAARRQAARSCAAISAARRSRWCTRPRAATAACTTVEVPQAERQRFCLEDADVIALAQARRSSSRSTTARRWTSSGARTAPRGKIYILQARPETVQSRAGRTIQRFTLKARSHGAGRAGAASASASAPAHARVIRDVEGDGARAARATCWWPT